MSDPAWIEKSECLAFHNELLSRFGGLEGIRDEGMLESALNRPQQLLHYGKPNLFELAASYAIGIITNHPFVDGNKRSGLMAAAVFLEINGKPFNAPEEEAVIMTCDLAAGEVGEAAYAAWLEKSCTKPSR